MCASHLHKHSHEVKVDPVFKSNSTKGNAWKIKVRGALFPKISLLPEISAMVNKNCAATMTQEVKAVDMIILTANTASTVRNL